MNSEVKIVNWIVRIVYAAILVCLFLMLPGCAAVGKKVDSSSEKVETTKTETETTSETAVTKQNIFELFRTLSEGFNTTIEPIDHTKPSKYWIDPNGGENFENAKKSTSNTKTATQQETVTDTQTEENKNQEKTTQETTLIDKAKKLYRKLKANVPWYAILIIGVLIVVYLWGRSMTAKVRKAEETKLKMFELIEKLQK